jgi:hypothetical protein
MNAQSVTGERRSHAAIQLVALYITILVNVVAMVWGAATLTAEVSQLREEVTPLVADVYKLKVEQAIRIDRELRAANPKERDK